MIKSPKKFEDEYSHKGYRYTDESARYRLHNPRDVSVSVGDQWLAVSANEAQNENAGGPMGIPDFLTDPKAYLAACAARYGIIRYLRHLPEVRLNSRENDITANLWMTDASGVVTRLDEPTRREYFMRLYAELQEERRIRTGGNSVDIDEAALIANASAAYTSPRLTTPSPHVATAKLLRFGQYKYIESALTKGSFRVAPASNYADPSLSTAQYDEELRHHAVTASWLCKR